MIRVTVLIFLLIFSITATEVSAQSILHVGPGQTYANPATAAAAAHPGDTILIHPASYTGAFFIENLKGRANAWITIKGIDRNLVIFQGGIESMHFIDPEYVVISDLTITGQTGNGMNIDDGGSYATPAKHLIIDHCIFHDMNASGNNDMLKLSGVDSFTVSNCRFENGSAGGSGIDMVGCHNGLFLKNQFIHQGSNSIQAKGGSSDIHIERNYFSDGGDRAINLGGSTDSPYFRPFGANYEAKDLLVTANVFEGSDAPIAFVGCRNVRVINNTIIEPVVWIFRILQESSDTSFYLSCANNVFSNNIVVVTNSLRTDINIGPYTSPESFIFSNNLWFHLQNPNWNGPQLPSIETGAIVKKNPLFKNYAAKDYQLTSNSPAIGKGKKYNGYSFDYNDHAFLNPPSIGALEKNEVIATKESGNENDFKIVPNPFRDYLILNDLPENTPCFISDLQGKIIYQFHSSSAHQILDLSTLKAGLYQFNFYGPGFQQSRFILKEK